MAEHGVKTEEPSLFWDGVATFLLFVAVIAAAALVPGQALVAQVRVVNLAPHARHDVVTVTLPLKQGAWPEQGLAVGGHKLQLRPFGSRWPDGTPRFARARMRVELGAGERRTIPVHLANEDHAAPPWALHPRISLPVLLGLRMDLQVGDKPLHLLQGLQHVPSRSGRLVQCWRSFHRAGPAWAELTVEAPSGLPVVRWWLQTGYSDRGPNRTHTTRETWLHVDGAACRVDDAWATVLEQGDARRWKLVAGGQAIADGQSRMLSGALLFGGTPDPAMDETLRAAGVMETLAVADWRQARGYGPFGRVPAAPARPQLELRELLRARAMSEFLGRPQSPWQVSQHLCRTNPAGTGGQPGFGIVTLGLDLQACSPLRFHALRRSCYQEACRPQNHRETDGRLLSEINHPRLVLHNGTPHPRSKDLVGKEAWGWTKYLGGWRGYDREHYVMQPLLELALVTGDAGLERLVETAAEVWLPSNPDTERGTAHHTPAVSRGTGRTMKTGAWLYLLTADKRLAGRLRYLAKAVADKPTVRQRSPEPRMLDGRTPYVPFWELGIEATGLLASAAVTGDASSRGRSGPGGDPAGVHPRGQEVGIALRDQCARFAGAQAHLVGHDQVGAARRGAGHRPGDGRGVARARQEDHWLSPCSAGCWVGRAAELADTLRGDPQEDPQTVEPQLARGKKILPDQSTN